MKQTRDYRRDEHRLHLIIYHLIWCPRRRKPVLAGPVAARCQELIAAKCAEKGWEMLALAIPPDHVHLFVRVWPSDGAAEVVKACKGITSFALRKEFPHLPQVTVHPDAQLLRVHGGRGAPRDHSALHRCADGTVEHVEAVARVRKTYKEKLRPTPAQARQLEEVLWRCRVLYNTALEQRIAAWERCRVSVTRYQQEAELKAIRADVPGLRRHPQPRAARRAGPAGQDLSGLLPPPGERRATGVSPLPGP